MSELVYTTSRVVSTIGRFRIHCLTAHEANQNKETIEFSQDLIGELQNHLRDILDLTNRHDKADDHDGSANLRSNAIMTMVSLLEIHRTLARCEIAPAAMRQHSRSKCGELLSNVTLTAQKVVVADGKYLSNFIVVCIEGLSDCTMSSLTHVIVVRHNRKCECPRYYGRHFASDGHVTPLHRRICRDIHAPPLQNHMQKLPKPL